MQKTPRNSVLISITFFFPDHRICRHFNVITKKTVTFSSADQLLITADEYIIEDDNPYILLFHQQESSRGEFYYHCP